MFKEVDWWNAMNGKCSWTFFLENYRDSESMYP